MKYSLLLLPLVLAWAAVAVERDPFAVPAAGCIGELAEGWHYRGRIASESEVRGLVRTPAGKWRRIAPGELLTAGWLVTEIGAGQLVLQPQDSRCGSAIRYLSFKEPSYGQETAVVTIRAERRATGGNIGPGTPLAGRR